MRLPAPRSAHLSWPGVEPCLYVAPLELAKYRGTSSINISRLWRSGPITLIPMTFYLQIPQIFSNGFFVITTEAYK
jgi:hypothetical protein